VTSCRRRARWQLAVTSAVRRIGWLPVVGSGAAVGLLLVLDATVWRGVGGALVPKERVVDAVLPLAVGLQAAFLLSPEDEKPLELLLSCPRPLSWTLAERLLAMVLLQGGVAVVGTVASLAMGAEGITLAVGRWLSPSLLLGSIAVYLALSTRQGALGALSVVVLWGGMLLGGDALLERWPWLWPLHLYLQPDSVSLAAYCINRATLALAGVVFISLSVSLTRDEERLLGIRGAGRGGAG